MEIKKIILSGLLFLIISCFCFAQNQDAEQNEDWHTVRLLGDDWGEGSASEIAQGLVQEEFEKVLEDEGSFYILTDDEDNQYIIQEFKWEASEYVYMYRFVVERKTDDGVYEEYDVQDVEENFADCMLVAGEYRYKIGLYNFLGIIELWTDWVPITVKKAIKPFITDVSPDSLYVDTGEDAVFSVKGKDLSESATFKLIKLESDLEFPAEVIDKNVDKNQFTVQVSGLNLEDGKYSLTVRNEGGLLYHYTPISLVHSPVDFYLSFRRSWAIPLGRDVIHDYWYWDNTFSNSSLLSLLEDNDLDFWRDWGTVGDVLNYIEDFYDYSSIAAKFTVIPFKSRSNLFGFSLDATTLQCVNQENHSNSGKNYEINSNISMFSFDFVYQHSFGNHFNVDVHAGAGVSLLNIDISYGGHSHEEIESLGLCFNGGVVMQLFPWRHFYLELGADYIFNLFKGINVQYVAPELSIGWRF